MNDERSFEQIVEQALQLQSSGASRDEILSRFPEFSTDLAPLLDAAAMARKGLLANQTLPTPNLARGREKLLRSARAIVSVRKPRRWFAFSFPQYAAAGALAVLIAVLIGGNASAALPGDLLYPFKLGFEQVQLGLTLDADAKENFQNELDARRVSEVQAVIAKKRETNVGFQGVVESASGGTVVISGLPVKIPPQTTVQPGEVVRIEGKTFSDGGIVASQIQSVPTRPPGGPTRPRPTQPGPPARPSDPSPANRTRPAETPLEERTRPVQSTPSVTTTRPQEIRPTNLPASVPPQITGTRLAPPVPPQTFEPPRSPPPPGERPTDPRGGGGRTPDPRPSEPPPPPRR